MKVEYQGGNMAETVKETNEGPWTARPSGVLDWEWMAVNPTGAVRTIGPMEKEKCERMVKLLNDQVATGRESGLKDALNLLEVSKALEKKLLPPLQDSELMDILLAFKWAIAKCEAKVVK